MWIFYTKCTPLPCFLLLAICIYLSSSIRLLCMHLSVSTRPNFGYLNPENYFVAWKFKKYRGSSNSMEICPKNCAHYLKPRYLKSKNRTIVRNHANFTMKLNSLVSNVNHTIVKPHCLNPHYSRTLCIRFEWNFPTHKNLNCPHNNWIEKNTEVDARAQH